MLLPMVLVLGLVLIPVGVIRKRRLDAAALAQHEQPPHLPVIDLNNQHIRGVLLASVAIGAVSIVLLGSATYKGVEVMESVAFCGTACHTVMQPEYTAFQRSPHSRLRCADCHIGQGADWFVKSKISGSWQWCRWRLNLYPTPIPSPVHSLRPARETCEQCHWPTKYRRRQAQGAHQVRRRRNQLRHEDGAADEDRRHAGHASTASTGTSIRGCRSATSADPSRQTIYDVEMTAARRQGDRPSRPTRCRSGATEWRSMDCVDCHNRPSHTYKMPGAEIDSALDDGRIDRTLPFIKREGLRVLAGAYPSHEEAQATIAREIDAFYKAKYPDLAASKAPAIAAAGKALGDIYSWNVFPKMKVTWGTYPNNIGPRGLAGLHPLSRQEARRGGGREDHRQLQRLPRASGRRREGPGDPEGAQALSRGAPLHRVDRFAV